MYDVDKLSAGRLLVQFPEDLGQLALKLTSEVYFGRVSQNSMLAYSLHSPKNAHIRTGNISFSLIFPVFLLDLSNTLLIDSLMFFSLILHKHELKKGHKYIKYMFSSSTSVDLNKKKNKLAAIGRRKKMLSL